MNSFTELFSKPDCQPCKAVERTLIKYGVAYEKHDVTTDLNARARVAELGYQAVPVIIAPDGSSFQGYQPAKIKALLDE